MSESPQPEIDVPAAPVAPPPAAGRQKICANCGAPMHGPFCYACGQPEKGMIRHLASVMADVADTIFNVDSRIFRSLLPLYFRPGYLTNEYFLGRRTRYVTPFRLFFFLCVISFFVMQISLNIANSNFSLDGDNGGVGSAKTEAEVQERKKAALDGIEKARNATGAGAGVGVTKSVGKELDQAAAHIEGAAQKRLAWLTKKHDAEARGDKPPPDPNEDDGTLSFDGTPWDPGTHPIAVDWLPAFANAKLNELATRARDNIKLAKRDPRHFVLGLFSVLPQTLFVLMPLFAVLLKIFYIFKRRLYMEHLMVALHSHAFIFMSLLVLAMLSLLHQWAATSFAPLVPVVNLLRAAAWTWLPIYLFLMQKRVYKQGWFMTTIKFGMIGFSYVILLSFGLAGALIATLTLE